MACPVFIVELVSWLDRIFSTLGFSHLFIHVVHFIFSILGKCSGTDLWICTHNYTSIVSGENPLSSWWISPVFLSKSFLLTAFDFFFCGWIYKLWLPSLSSSTSLLYRDFHFVPCNSFGHQCVFLGPWSFIHSIGLFSSLCFTEFFVFLNCSLLWSSCKVFSVEICCDLFFPIGCCNFWNCHTISFCWCLRSFY